MAEVVGTPSEQGRRLGLGERDGSGFVEHGEVGAVGDDSGGSTVLSFLGRVQVIARERSPQGGTATLARAQARHADPFWDVTVSVSKSITLFYGGLLAKAEQERQAGHHVEADHFERQAALVWEAIMVGNAAALEYLQDEAGLTRTGYHRGTGAETTAELGKWEHARDWIVGSFRQHTSRTGDPQLHVHNLVLAKVVTERDGRWRKLDSKDLYRFQGSAARQQTDLGGKQRSVSGLRGRVPG